jgi:hypothetical protein
MAVDCQYWAERSLFILVASFGIQGLEVAILFNVRNTGVDLRADIYRGAYCNALRFAKSDVKSSTNQRTPAPRGMMAFVNNGIIGR